MDKSSLIHPFTLAFSPHVCITGKSKDQQAHEVLRKLRGKNVNIDAELRDIKMSANELETTGSG